MKYFFAFICCISLGIGIQFPELRFMIGVSAMSFLACLDYIIND